MGSSSFTVSLAWARDLGVEHGLGASGAKRVGAEREGAGRTAGPATPDAALLPGPDPTSAAAKLVHRVSLPVDLSKQIRSQARKVKKIIRMQPCRGGDEAPQMVDIPVKL